MKSARTVHYRRRSMRPNAEEGRIEQICLTDKTFDYEVRRHFDLGSDLHHCSGAVMDKSTLKLSVVTQNGLKRAREIGSFISKKPWKCFFLARQRNGTSTAKSKLSTTRQWQRNIWICHAHSFLLPLARNALCLHRVEFHNGDVTKRSCYYSFNSICACFSLPYSIEDP